MNDISFKQPENQEEFIKYNLFRWEILRKPIGKSIESLNDDYEDSSFHLIGVKKEQIVGCGRLHFINPNEAQIRYMAVDEKYQRNGVGKEVIRLLEKEAKRQNAKKIILNARDHVLDFYKKFGYISVKKYDGSDTGIPHTRMEKII